MKTNNSRRRVEGYSEKRISNESQLRAYDKTPARQTNKKFAQSNHTTSLVCPGPGRLRIEQEKNCTLSLHL